jgi:alpha-beta hydrolase superfamily lysophospholipase
MSTKKGPLEPAAKRRRAPAADAMRPEYDFSQGVRSKYAARYRAGTNVVRLDPDVAERFPTAEVVNRALRAIARIADETESPRKSRRRTA